MGEGGGRGEGEGNGGTEGLELAVGGIRGRAGSHRAVGVQIEAPEDVWVVETEDMTPPVNRSRHGI